MAEKLDVSPTRGNLLRLEDELERIREGHDLLDRKREVLTRELLDMMADALSLEREAEERLEAAHEAIREARMRMGVNRIRWLSLAPSARTTVEVRARSIMGVTASLVDVEIERLPLPYGSGDTSVALDEARERWLDVARLLGELVETTVTVWRLATELRKTQRRVNALEENVIPQYQATVDHISDALEEEEREEIVHAKKVKEMHGGTEE
ncbi:MAG: V-type ATP synthase subunit D [Candidatus Promineifilaceae bacterium]|nr:V-type ATP synthase subunit D [Candidatus Promineifilaceae bacterium]